MDVIIVFNGLGNQMSQYALYLSKKALCQNVRCLFMDTAHNGIELNSLFGVSVQASFFDKLLMKFYLKLYKDRSIMPYYKRKLWDHNVYLHFESGYSYDASVLNRNKRGLVFYHGGWHNPKYFKNIDDTIREVYKFPLIDDEKNLSVKEQISASNAVVIHIRRGDFLDSQNYDVFGKVCTEAYFRNAIRYMESVIENPIYYVFSNDFVWSRNFLNGKKCVFVDWNVGNKSWKDMYLMSCSNNIIISNSTFSWWGAYLGVENKRVCRPPFFIYGDKGSNIYLDEWIEISNEE